MQERIVGGLQRKSIANCSKWAMTYREMGQPFPGRWTFDHHPWAKDMCDCESERMVGQKGAQLGFTEVALNKVFYNMDIYARSCLYVLPTNTPDANNFSSNRFDPALEMSPHLANLFSDIKNIGNKRAGSASLYIRGSRSRNQLKSIPVSMCILDEVDEMVQANIPLAFERMSGHMDKQIFLLSTPTIPKTGINAFFITSSQDHFMFKCPHCTRITELVWPDCFVVRGESITDPDMYKSYIRCKECKVEIKQKEKAAALKETGRWESSYTDRVVRGFYINQLYSKTIKPHEIAESNIKARTDPAHDQEFHNSKMGLTKIVEGAQINDVHLDMCRGEYKKQTVSPHGSIITMGIDVGTWLHYEISQWWIEQPLITTDISTLSRCRLLTEGKVKNFEELDVLMRQFSVNFAVVDANPEKRMALSFAQRFYGIVKLCYYGRGVNSKQISVHSDEECTVTVDRTSWMDASLGRFKAKRIALPIDLSTEYKDHIKEPVRVYKRDANGNLVGGYVTAEGHDDHFAHARTYCEIALPLGVSLMGNKDINELL